MAKVSMPSSNTRLNFVLNDFSGGLVNNVNDVKMKDNESPDMLNMQFRNDGLIQKRPGTIFLDDTGFGNDLIEVMVFSSSPKTIHFVYNTYSGVYFKHGDYQEIYKLHDSPAIKGGYATFMGNLYFLDGLNLYCFNYKELKISKITNPPDDYTPSPKPAIIGVEKEKEIGNCPIITNNTPSGTEIPNIKKCERWYEPCEYELEDGYKGTGMIPICCTLIKVKGDRIYLSGNEADPNMVYISDILQPLYFPASLPVQTPPTDDYITALHVYNDDLIIGRKHSIFALFGNTNRSDDVEQYRLVEINTHTGMANSISANSVHHMMFFAGSDGNYYKLHPPSTTADTMYTTQLNTKLDITLPPFNQTVDSNDFAITFFDSPTNLWYVQLGDITLVYNYQLQAWTRYNNINALSFFNVDGELWFCRDTGCVYMFASKEGNQHYYDEYYDLDARVKLQLPVYAYWTSRNMDFGVPARVKQFRDTYVTSECFESYPTTVNIKYEVDYIDVRSSFTIENEISKWGRAVFGVSKFASRNIDRSLPLMINRRGRTIKVFYGCGYEYYGSMPTLPPPGLIPEYNLVYAIDVGTLYLRVPRREGYEDKFDKYYIPFPEEELNQALLVHNIMGVYELKGYR